MTEQPRPRWCPDCPPTQRVVLGRWQQRCQGCRKRRAAKCAQALEKRRTRDRKAEERARHGRRQKPERRFIMRPDFLQALPALRAELERQCTKPTGCHLYLEPTDFTNFGPMRRREG